MSVSACAGFCSLMTVPERHLLLLLDPLALLLDPLCLTEVDTM